MGSKISKAELKEMFFHAYDTVEEAVEDSLRLYGQDASFVVIPHASDIFVTVEDEQPPAED